MPRQRVLLAEIMANDSNQLAVAQAMGSVKTTAYSLLPPETCPPVALNWGMGLAIMDGRHRIAAALLRGDESILAD